jgi:uncharacterized protein YyaL (SSP411 family)
MGLKGMMMIAMACTPKDKLAEALAAQGEGYVPRTHHKGDDGKPRFTNRLIFESSPYLLQHAHNPVDWYPWGDEAFAKARAENKLVLMSIGYSTCHWCHVMERESFEDLEIAAYLNAHYIAVKVDREERPDVDSVYMNAVQLLTGRGGWPMTTILTPDREVIFGGTYFPPRDGARGAHTGFLTLLKHFGEQHLRDAASLQRRARDMSAQLARQQPDAPRTDLPSAAALHEATTLLLRGYDRAWGGFGGGNKFPRPAPYHFLLRTGETEKVLHTLGRMAAGGMHDHVGGGFHRYSTDPQWLVPHFEKMLYDNAQLAVLYLEGFQLSHDERLRRVAERTLDYVLREMTSPEGGFYSATDADSPAPSGHDEEGLYFTWNPVETRAALGERAARFDAHFDVTARGNFEGRSILHTQALPDGSFDRDLARLYAARALRAAPILDDKIITAWNALMVSALARVGSALGVQRYLEAAGRAAEFLWTSLRGERGLRTTWRRGVAKHRAVLDDYAFLVQALLDQFEASGEARWFERARTLQHEQDAGFGDFAGGYYLTARDAEPLLVREKPDYDGAIPSGNSVAAQNLLRLHQFTDEPTYRESAARLLTRASVKAPLTLCALAFYYDRPLQIVLVGSGRTPFHDVLGKAFVPHRVLVSGETAGIAIAANKPMLEGKPTAYVCRGNVCDLPTTDPAVFAQQLRAERDVPPPGSQGQ